MGFDPSFLGQAAGIVIIASLFLKYITGKDKAQEHRDAAQAKRDQAFVNAIEKMSKTHREVAISNKEIAKYTKQGNDEAKERNGHLAELQLEGREISNMNAQAILKAVSDMKTQHVSIQNVDKQTIKKE